MPTQSSCPCAVAISSDDIDISETSKSLNLSCRQNISDGWMMVGTRSMPSGFTVPSRIGHERGLDAVARLRVRRMRGGVRAMMVGGRSTYSADVIQGSVCQSRSPDERSEIRDLNSRLR